MNEKTITEPVEQETPRTISLTLDEIEEVLREIRFG